LSRPLLLLALPAFAALPLADCREATEITVVVTTDVDCSHVTATSIAIGAVAGLDMRPASAETKTNVCAAGRIGALVVVPSGHSDAEVAIRVVVGLDGKTPDACVNDGFKGGCIVARRALHFLPHAPLTVPVEMRASCRDVGCAASSDLLQTCLAGQCVPATIPDSNACTGSGCDIDHGDGGVAEAGGPLPEAGVGLPCDTTGAQPSAAWPMFGYCASHRARSPFVGPQVLPHIVADNFWNADPLRSVLLDAQGNVYLVTTDGKYLVLDPNNLTSNTPRWTYTSPDKPIVGMGALGADGTLYVPQNKSIAAVVAQGTQGVSRWAQPFSVGNGVAGPITLSPTRDIIFHDTVSTVTALSPDGTTVAWSFDAKASLQNAVPAVVIDGTAVFSADDSSVIGVSKTGQQLFRQMTPGVLSDTMVLLPYGTYRLVDGANGGTLFGLDMVGRPLWQTPLPGRESFHDAVADDGTVYFGLDDGMFHAYDAGGVAGKTLSGGAFGSPTIGADGIVYVCGGSVMYAFRPDGSTLWSFDLMQAGAPLIAAAPAIGKDGALYVTTSGGDVMKIGP
jgi:outer membrane protein assembly factor BamB